MNILDIPQELLHLILLSMDIKSFVRFSRSCKFLNNTCQDNLIWKFFVEKDFKDFLLFPPRNVPASWLLKISRDFKKFYISSWNCTNLSGQWKAIYGMIIKYKFFFFFDFFFLISSDLDFIFDIYFHYFFFFHKHIHVCF